MAFRDENEALRAKVRALQDEVETLRSELDGRDEPPLPDPPPARRDALVENEADGKPLAALVREREQAIRKAEALAEQREREKREKRIARYADRLPRVTVEAAGGRRRILIAPKLLRDQLLAQLGWGFGFIFVNPGVFIVVLLTSIFLGAFELPFGQAVLAGITSWVCLLSAGNLAYAQTVRRRVILDLTADGHFAIYARRAKDPILLGRTAALKVRIDEPDPSRLGSARFSDGRGEVEIDRLSAADLRSLREILPSGG
jgi:hypothetical protein